ncbi:hypothetical protein HRG84_23805 [Flavisolibacter sp. BT320]|nr:hypothetical protein [Flavisolibacter longurius]
MGYEFLIKVRLSDEDKVEVTKLFNQKPNYSSTVTVDSTEYLEFKNEEGSRSQMPDFTTAFDVEGIYVCQNSINDVWTNLDDLKEYLQRRHKDFYVEEL